MGRDTDTRVNTHTSVDQTKMPGGDSPSQQAVRSLDRVERRSGSTQLVRSPRTARLRVPVTAFTADWCGACKHLKEVIQSTGVDARVVNVTGLNLAGVQAYPIVRVGAANDRNARWYYGAGPEVQQALSDIVAADNRPQVVRPSRRRR